MFTGLIQGLGRIEGLTVRGDETRFRIRPEFEMAGVQIGESIAVNGVCLTVEEERGGAFSAYASGETTSRTALGTLKSGDAVNLERALAMGDRLGGHLVSGHVDAVGAVQSVAPAGDSIRYRIGFPAEHATLVVDKGSIALDGISLTVNACGADFLEVNIIPETQRATTIASWSPGTEINLEFDLIGKYVQKMLAAWLSGGGSAPRPSTITEEFLRKHGF